MGKDPFIEVNAVGVVSDDNRFLVTLGASNSRTARYRFDETHFLLLIVEYAKARGIELPALDGLRLGDAKAWTPWVVGGEKKFE